MQAITALPQGAVSKLSASQALTDSSAVVKELIENALDARATTISVEVSTNCLDRIRVRDNGFGIRPEDRSLICKKYCTSKIRSLDDLDGLGGQTLGFRGEALASAAELSSALTIWTRIEGEEVAQMIEFNKKGSIVSQRVASQPTGTTVQIDSFLKAFPVRRQTAEKVPAQSMAKIRRLLQNFVFARPQVRFSLKMLKAKDSRGDWAYVPNTSAIQGEDHRTMYFDALTKIHGKLVLEKCSWVSSKRFNSMSRNLPANSADSTDNNSDCQFEIEGIVVDAQCVDPTTLMSLGHFVSVDRRSMSCNQGILREVVRHYRACIRRTFSPSEAKRVLDPLLILNISCQRATYDVNVEPGKDDVLFYKPQELQLAVQSLLDSYYKEAVPRHGESQTSKQNTNSPGFDILSTRKLNDPQSSSMKARAYEIGKRTPFQDYQLEKVSGSSILGQATSGTSRDLEVMRRQTAEGDFTRESSTADAREAPISEHELLSKARYLHGNFSTIKDAYGRNLHRTKRGISDARALGGIALIESSPSGRQHQTSAESTCSSSNASSSKHSLGPHAASLTLPEYLPEPASNRQSEGSPSASTHNVSRNSSYRFGQIFSIGPGLLSPSSPQIDRLPMPQRRVSDTTSPLTSSSPSPIHPDLALTLDYEHRKQKATLDYRKKLRKEKAAGEAAARCREEVANGTQQTLDSLFRFLTKRSSGVSPHQSRYQKAVATLQSSANPPDSPSINDSRINFMPTPFSQPFTRGKKAQKHLLSHAGESFTVIDLVMPVPWTLGQIRREMRRSGECDTYTNDETNASDAFLGLGERGTLPAEWEARVRSVLRGRFPGVEAAVDELPLEIDLQFGSSAQNR